MEGIIVFDGFEFEVERGYYKRVGPKTLHQAVWEHYNGTVLKGCIIHHKDKNPLNNDIGNLELLTKKEHKTLHVGRSKWNGSVENFKNLENARKKASKWHGSEEGKAFHKALGMYTWKKYKVKKIKHCIVCNKEYSTYWPSKAKYCSRKCANKIYIAERKKPHNLKKCTCVICQKSFESYKYSTARTCGQHCSRMLQKQTRASL